MPTPVLMPQMGESIAEGTIVRWMKKVGDVVDRDEPLFEISTDKVDAEIPSPAAGVLTNIAVVEGQTVPVNSVVATIGGEAVDVPGAEAPASQAPPAPTPQGDGSPAKTAPPANVPAPSAPAPASLDVSHGAQQPASADAPKHRSSPLVRRIAKEHNVDVAQIAGSGSGGRVTKTDILGYLESHKGQPDAKTWERVEVRPLSVMRRKIAEHMVLSRRTSAHVHTVFHVNFSTVERIRKAKKAHWESKGVKLTYMAFIASAVVDALRRHPVVNASLDEQNVVYKKDINLGIAVAVEGGLIVPVVKNADEKSLLGLSRAISDLADRARAKQLKPDEVHDGTFTITNPGHFGAQFGMPIINQPQVAILGVGAIEKRPVVIDDAIGIRPMAYLTLGFDHRLIDGAVADEFMADIKKGLEEFDEESV